VCAGGMVLVDAESVHTGSALHSTQMCNKQKGQKISVDLVLQVISKVHPEHGYKHLQHALNSLPVSWVQV